MSDRKFSRRVAEALAFKIASALAPACVRIEVAGSIRRQRDWVGDIELLYVPKIEQRPDPCDLLGHPVDTNLVDLVLGGWLREGKLARRANSNGSSIWGEKNKLALHVPSGIPVDFFSASEATWACQLVCRTGSAESNIAVCQAAIARGLTWQPYGEGFADRLTGEQLKRCRTEAEVFAAVGLPCKPPCDR